MVYVRYCWIVLMVALVAGCGQPLQINTQPTPRTTQIAAPPTQLSAAGTAPIAADRDTTPSTSQPFVTAEAMPEAPTVVAAPIVTPAIVVVPQTAVPLNNEQRWRTQQLNRQVFDQQRLYIANNDVTLLWYDPMTGQSLTIGTIRGEFTAQARFTLRTDRRPALEVPYRINQDFGLTAISEAVRARMKAAGYSESVEAYIEQTDIVVPK